jgi:hypothetical protein
LNSEHSYVLQVKSQTPKAVAISVDLASDAGPKPSASSNPALRFQEELKKIQAVNEAAELAGY